MAQKPRRRYLRVRFDQKIIIIKKCSKELKIKIKKIN